MADVDVVLGGGDGTGDVEVSQLNTLDDFSVRKIKVEIPVETRSRLYHQGTLRMHVQHYEGCRSCHRQREQKHLQAQ